MQRETLERERRTVYRGKQVQSIKLIFYFENYLLCLQH